MVKTIQMKISDFGIATLLTIKNLKLIIENYSENITSIHYMFWYLIIGN